MSGIEVAGIILGVIPVVISALESYNAGLSAFQRWRKYEREIRSLTRNLETERLRLQTVCEKLLIGLVAPSRIEQMVHEPMGHLWREEGVRRKIQARLWKSAKNFEETLMEMREAIGEIAEKIKPNLGSSVLDLKRVDFTLKRSRYAELLATIEKGNSSLENLTDRNIELEPKRRVRSQGKLLDILRDISRSLYKALASSMSCNCKHDVSLRLESRSVDISPLEDDDKIIKDLSFWLALSVNKEYADARKGAQGWMEMLVRTLSDSKTLIPPPSPMFSPDKRPKPKGKTVSFNLSGTTLSASSSATSLRETVIKSKKAGLAKSISSFTVDVASIGLAGVAKPNDEIMIDLCERLHKAQKEAQVHCYGRIASPDKRQFGVYPAPPLRWVDHGTFDTTTSFISLREALSVTDPTQIPHISYRDRLHLAVVLSSSILQLSNTQWLPETISCHEIFFLAQTNYPMYEHAFVIKSLSEQGNRLSHTASQPFGFMRNLTLLSLGVLLIELILGKPLDSLRTSQEEATVTLSRAFADYMTAQRLLTEVQRASSNYGSAVLRCIDGEFHRKGVGLEDKDLRQEVYAGIVALLEKDLENA